MTLVDIRRHCLSLSGVTEAPHHQYTSFRVSGRIFATAPRNGDVVHIMIDEEQREQALILHPEFVEKLFWGEKAVGARVQLAKANPATVRNLLTNAHAAKAAKPSSRVQSNRID